MVTESLTYRSRGLVHCFRLAVAVRGQESGAVSGSHHSGEEVERKRSGR